MTDRVDVSVPATKRSMLPHALCVRRGGLWTAAVLALVGVLFVWQASQLDLGSVALPGPGFLPFVLGAVLAALAGVIGAEIWRQAANAETVDLGHRDVILVCAAMLAIPPLFEPLGAYVTLGLFGAVLLVVIGRVSLVLAGAAAVIGMAACWYFFQVLLGLQLPTGPF
jgi:putative tricarboxylic transport membrane protein